MNQELIRQQIRKLKKLSEWMLSEFDGASQADPTEHLKFIFKKTETILSLRNKARKSKKPELLTSELWVDPWVYKFENQSNLIKIDPFIPKTLRIKISRFYSKRCADMSTVYNDVMETFCIEAYEGKIKGALNYIQIEVWQKLNAGYAEKGWSWEKSSSKIESLLRDIEQYLMKIK